MILLYIIILIFGIVLHRDNYLIIAMIIEIINLIISLIFISINLSFFAIIFLGITGAETAIGLSILLGYYNKTLL